MIMSTNENINPDGSSSRRKFVLGVGVFSLLATAAAAVGLRFSSKKTAPTCEPEAKKRTMLTQDGQLVEIDENFASAGKKISNSELQNWIKK
jgi:hypothetical protein